MAALPWGVRMPGDFRLGAWWVRPSQNTIQCDGKTIRLEPKMVEVLVCLAEHPGETVAKEKLIGAVWGDTFVTDDVLTRCISELRKALDDDPKEPRVIETIPKRGYRLLAKIGRAEPARRFGQRSWRWLVAGAAVLLLPAASMVRLLKPPAVPQLIRISPVGNDEAAIAGALYRDGSRIYYNRYWKDGVHPAVVSAGGGEANSIPISSDEAWIFDVSPRGDQLLLTHTWPMDDGPIFIAPVLGGAPRRLGNVSGHDSRWSNDGGKIVYCRAGELRIVNTDGSDDHQLAAVKGTPRWPRWSPDSTRIRFTLLDSGNISTSSLWEVSAQGTHLHTMLPGWPPSAAPRIGEWTPDGRYFLFEATRDGLSSLWVLSEQRTVFGKSPSPVQLTVGPMDFGSVVPSSDGKKIFAVGTQRIGELVRYDVRTKQFVRYLSGLSADGLVYSPGLQFIAYTDFATGVLYRSLPDGSKPFQLTTPPLRAMAPRWSPDGKRIAFMGRSPGGRVKIYIVSSEGGTPEEVAAGESNL